MLTVLNVAYSLATVGEAIGGAEQVLSDIDRALVAAGATSIVIACDGSRACGVLRTTSMPPAHFDDAALARAQRAQACAIASVLDDYPVDVVHLHGVDFLAYLPAAGVPALATLHLPPSWYAMEAFAPPRPDTFVHCVSESQRRSCPPSAALLPTIPNGVAIPALAPFHGERREVVALGRICPEKGFHIALAAAHSARVPMTLAGRVFPYRDHLAYWTRDIVPLLDAERRFVGPVGVQRRTELLMRARCVLVPSLVPETSSLVAMEALAAGTPVVAFGKGALPEIIEHGVTGFLVRDEREMASAIQAAGDLDPDACRAAAVERFPVDAMTQRYLERYTMLARRGQEQTERASAADERSHSVALTLPRRASLEITTVRSEAALRALAPAWRRLADTAQCTPFQRPEWVLPWWRHFGAGVPSVLVAHHDGELVGLVPLYVRNEVSGERVLALIGTGNSDYVDMVAHPAHRREVASLLAEYVVDTSAGWDRCDLGPLPERSALLTSPTRIGWRVVIDKAGVCPVLTLRAGASLEGSIPARFLSQLRYASRRLAREHDVRIEDSPREDALDALCALHGMRWQSRGADGVLADARVRAFHGDVVAAMADANLLRLYVMRVDDRIAAAFYGFADARRLYYYIGGFDPSFARYSVGSLVILHAVEAGAADGVREVDFLSGAEPYKHRWGATDRAVHRWRMIAADAAVTDAA